MCLQNTWYSTRKTSAILTFLPNVKKDCMKTSQENQGKNLLKGLRHLTGPCLFTKRALSLKGYVVILRVWLSGHLNLHETIESAKKLSLCDLTLAGVHANIEYIACWLTVVVANCIVS